MAKTSWEPGYGNLFTRWATQVDSENPLPEYPRPQLIRPRWLNLNGLWAYAILDRAASAPEKWDGQILVPFAVESALSGVKRALQPSQRLWYQRSFTIPQDWMRNRILLHFGAVDFETEVWINTQKVGSHRGGYLPFSLDIRDALQEGENTLTVAVWDPTDAGQQERGKQMLNPSGIWYTAVSGIWQTVWLEPVPEVNIDCLKITPDIDHETLMLEVLLKGQADGIKVQALALEGENEIGREESSTGQSLVLSIPHPRLWNSQDPFLYTLKVNLLQDGQVVDTVESYFAMRKFSLLPDQNGHLRFALNNKTLFLYGPLDQGYFPDGLYTAPTDEALRFDIEYTKRLGCNFIRKHIKIEPLRWYYHCDRLGMIVWQDMPNGGRAIDNTTSMLAMWGGLQRNDTRRLARFGRAAEQDRTQFRTDLQGMLDHLSSVPCIALWVVFNESWGQFHSREISNWVKHYDPTRLVDATSGWFDHGGGDFLSRHQYVLKLRRPLRRDKRAFILSEIGGYSQSVPGHVWNDKEKFGYRFYDTREALTEAYVRLLKNELLPLIAKGLAAAVYTETTDVEIEINGFLTYDRAMEKMDVERLAYLHREIIAVVEGV
jgi:beta-galactosidase/beta-glucuronidase